MVLPFHFVQEDDCEDLLDNVIPQHGEAFDCTKKIKAFIQKQYRYELGNDELLFMTVHIARIVKEARGTKHKTE